MKICSHDVSKLAKSGHTDNMLRQIGTIRPICTKPTQPIKLKLNIFLTDGVTDVHWARKSKFRYLNKSRNWNTSNNVRAEMYLVRLMR